MENESTTEKLLPAQNTTFDLRGGDLYLANGLQAMEAREVFVNGEAQELSVLGKVELPANKPEDTATIIFTRIDGDETGPITAYEIVEDGDRVVAMGSTELGIDGTGRVRTTSGLLELEESSELHKGWLRITARTGTNQAARVTVSEATLPKAETRLSANEKIIMKRRLKAIGAIAIVLVSLRGVVAPGAAYDHVMDPRHDAAGYVADVLGSTDDQDELLKAVPKTGEISDGVRFSREEVQKHIVEDMSGTYEAAERVGQTMEDLDTHNHDAIDKRAHEFKATHPDELYSEKQLDGFNSAIDQAQNVGEVRQVVAEFLNKYEKSALLGTEVKESSLIGVKDLAKATITAFGRLPASLIKLGNFGYVQYGPDKEDSKSQPLSMYGTTVAKYDGNTIHLMPLTDISKIPGNDILVDRVGTILHEFSHSLGVHRWETKKTTEQLKSYGLNLFSYVYGRPNYTSFYATSRPEEERAESGKDILNGDIVHPDNVGLFESRSNEKRLQFLRDLEKNLPGITDYLVAAFD